MYDRVACNSKMMQDVEEAARALARTEEEARSLASAINGFEEAAVALARRGAEPRYGVRYCRHCELSCPIGK